MEEVRSGDTVRVHYTGRLDDGTVFDSSRGRDPLRFEVGSGQVIRGFDDAVSGMRAGEEKTVTIPARAAYGDPREELVFTVPRDRLPPEIDARSGQQLQMQQGGETAVVTVRDVSDDEITLDANHPLAGRDLTFDLELVEIQD